MKTTADYLDAIKTKHHLPSDYAAAKLLGVTRAAVSRYRNGEGTFDDAVSIRAAELLDLDADELLLTAQAARAQDERARAAWARILKKAGYAAGVVMIAASTAGAPAPAHASAAGSGPTFGIMSTSNRRRPGHRPRNKQRAEKPRKSGFFFAIEQRRRRLS